MSEFNINLMRGQRPRLPVRRLGYVGMILYLISMTAVLVFCSYHSTRSAVRLSQQWHDAGTRTQAFHERYPDARGVAQYSRALLKQVGQLITRLERVEEVLADRVQVAEILAGLVAALPTESAITRMDLSEARRELEFDLAVPTADGESLDVMQLVSEWNRNETLMRQVAPIQSVVSRREEVAGRSMVVLHFSCGLVNGGGDNMDFGLFGRTRWQLVAWLLLPPLVVAALYGSLLAGLAYSEEALRRQIDLLERIPDLERAAARADTALAPARADGTTSSDRLEALSSRINEAARLNDMLVTGLGIAESSSSTVGDMMLITVKGQGEMRAVLGFMHGVEQPVGLCAVQSLKLDTVRYVPRLIHGVEMKIACLVLPHRQPVEGGP